MDNQKHTVTPWSICSKHSYRILDADLRPTAAALGGGHEKPFTLDENKANARRIVACVNRCEGVDTETLERSPDLASAFMSAENARLIQLNAELLLALRDMKERFESCISDGNGELPEDKPALEIAAAAITKAEAANHV